MTSSTHELDVLSINTIRVLSADMVQAANSGHPGMPMGMAPVAHVLWSRVMKYIPSNPKWWNRDRFLLSNGHGCALQYSMLHISGYNLPLKECQRFRQIDSLTPGHPEVHHTVGVEVTTGPLGQGVANGVGLALAQTYLASKYNTSQFPLFDNYTYVFAGDGCMQEGVASEAASLAGHWKLNRLIVIYDDNKVQIDGSTSLAFTESVRDRYKAYGWHHINVSDGDNDLNALEAAFKEAHTITDKPILISVHTTIGYGSKKQGTEKVHGEALGAEELKAVKKKFGFNPEESFVIAPSVYQQYQKYIESITSTKYQAWQQMWAQYKAAHADLAQEIEQRMSNQLPSDWKQYLPKWKPSDKADATRNTSGLVLNAIADHIPAIIGGSADLTPSNKTDIKSSHNYSAQQRDGRYIRYGVREFGMAAIANGIYAYGGFIPYTATFLNFIEYCFPAVRLSAISGFQQLYVMTHDSIGLGEDGPTHQPIEQLSACRATPNLLTFRPADGNETSGSYIAALELHQGPSVFALTRQNLPQLDSSSPEKVALGAYVVYETNPQESASNLHLIYVASGSEVSLAINAAKGLSNMNVRVVSMPCDGLFDKQSVEYRHSIITPGIPSISIECASILGWERYSHAHFGMTTYGASAPIDQVMKKFGFTTSQIIERTYQLLQDMKAAQSHSKLGVGLLPTHYQFSKSSTQSQVVH